MSCKDPNGTDHALQYNGDIAGTGVRLSFYLQNFILVLLVDRSYEDAENALWTFIATSFGLTISALAQVGDQGMNARLTLLEGILVSQLAWLANIGTFLALASYSRSKGKDNIVKFAAVLQGYFSMVLTIVMWRYANTFQLPDDPTTLRFVFLFGWELPALSSGRDVALVFSSLMIVVYTCVTVTEFRAWKNGKSAFRKREHDVEMAAKTPDRTRASRGSGGSAHRSRPSEHSMQPRPLASAVSLRRRHSPIRTLWLGVEVDPIFFGIVVAQIIIFTYFVTTTELIIQKSHACQNDTNQWGFGQVLALTVVLPSLIALYRAIHKNRIARLNKKDDIGEKSLPQEHRRSFGHSSPEPSGSTLPRAHTSSSLHLTPSFTRDRGERPGSPLPREQTRSPTLHLKSSFTLEGAERPGTPSPREGFSPSLRRKPSITLEGAEMEQTSPSLHLKPSFSLENDETPRSPGLLAPPPAEGSALHSMSLATFRA